MSQNFTQYPWAPQSYTDVHFSDCGKGIVLLWKHFVNKVSLTNVSEDLEVYQTISHGLQDYWRAHGFEPPSQAQLWQWASETSTVSDALQVLLVGGNCKKEICPLLGWEGNSDIAGRGMLAAYVIQAILITFYIPSLLMVRLDWLSDRRSKIPLIGRTLSAVQHSTQSFLDASIVFSIAMLSASLVSFANHDVFTSSTAAIMRLMPFSSVLPVALLQLAASNMLHRNRGRLWSWVLLTALMITLLVIAQTFIVYDPSTSKDLDQLNWELECLGKSSVDHIMWLSYGLAGLIILGVGCFVVGSFSASWQRHSAASWSRQVWWITLVTAFLAMWLCLGWFIHFQEQRNNLGGADNKDTEWSFGQILAVATWVPVIIEFVYIWWEKPVKALSGRLMDPYEVKEVSSETERFESPRRRETV